MNGHYQDFPDVVLSNLSLYLGRKGLANGSLVNKQWYRNMSMILYRRFPLAFEPANKSMMNALSLREYEQKIVSTVAAIIEGYRSGLSIGPLSKVRILNLNEIRL